MTKDEIRESERLDKELVEVLRAISIVSGRLARNISRYSEKKIAAQKGEKILLFQRKN